MKNFLRLVSVPIGLVVFFSLHGCSRHCYPTELQLAAEMEKKNCQDLGWTYWASENKNLRAIACTTSGGDVYHQFEATAEGLCEVKHLKETY